MRRELGLVEDLADRVYGAGSAVSIDRSFGGVRVTVWDARGEERRVAVGSTKTEALRTMRLALSEEST